MKVIEGAELTKSSKMYCPDKEMKMIYKATSCSSFSTVAFDV